MKANKKVVSAEEPKRTVIGTFEGMCADSNITNENGLDITRPVWEAVFESEDYKKALANGYYIGYLGHPDDPNCMDFKDACIVMKECHIEDDGKIYGSFDLVDTPVGRVVKSFIDAGVTFGISVRGAGDIIDNSVDPDTFVFRGFDLVTFPAYKEAVPTFTEIAASSDIDKVKKYKAVCAAVKKNIEDIDTCNAIDILQSQFAKQSDEYKMLEDRKQEIESGCSKDIEESDDVADVEEVDEEDYITSEKIEAMTELYLDTKSELDAAKTRVRILESQLRSEKADSRRRVESLRRISAAQMKDIEDELFRVTDSYQTVKAASTRMKKELQTLSESNLKYQHKIKITASSSAEKDSTISNLRSELSETVKKASDAEDRASNRDETVENLKAEITACTKLIQEYQEAYANLYASAVGSARQNIKITASTTVDELKSLIGKPVLKSSEDVEPTYIEEVDESSDDYLVTL